MREETLKRDLRGKVFTKGIHNWNKLLEDTIETDTLSAFKKDFDRSMGRKSLEGNGPNTCKWDSPRMSSWSTWKVGLKDLFSCCSAL